jgi:hypothetical protein
MSTTSTVLASGEHLSTWSDPVDLDRLAGRFTLKNLDPRLPADGADLRDVLPTYQGRVESWEEHRQRAESDARSEYGYRKPHPYRSITEESRLMVGTLALPEKLLQGTFKRLFGELSDIPTTWQVRAVAFALFNPPISFWGRQRWDDVCRRAELAAERRARITSQVKDLLALGE